MPLSGRRLQAFGILWRNHAHTCAICSSSAGNLGDQSKSSRVLLLSLMRTGGSPLRRGHISTGSTHAPAPRERTGDRRQRDPRRRMRVHGTAGRLELGSFLKFPRLCAEPLGREKTSGVSNKWPPIHSLMRRSSSSHPCMVCHGSPGAAGNKYRQFCCT
jgi:hypothetical protein